MAPPTTQFQFGAKTPETAFDFSKNVEGAPQDLWRIPQRNPGDRDYVGRNANRAEIRGIERTFEESYTSLYKILNNTVTEDDKKQFVTAIHEKTVLLVEIGQLKNQLVAEKANPAPVPFREISNLKKENAYQKQQISKCENLNSKYQDTILQLHQEIAQKSTHIFDYESLKTNLQNTITQLQQDVSQKTEQISNYENLRINGQNKVTQLQQDLSQKMEEIKKSADINNDTDTIIARLREEVRSQEAENADLRVKLANVQKNGDEAREARDKALATKENDIAEAQKSVITPLEAHIRHLEDEVFPDKDRAIRLLENGQKTAENERDEAKAKFKDLQSHITELKQEVVELTAAAEKSSVPDKTHDELREKVQKLKNELEAKKIANEGKEQDLNHLRAQIRRHGTHIASLTDDNDKFRARAADYEEIHAHLMEEREINRELRDEFEKMKQEMEALAPYTLNPTAYANISDGAKPSGLAKSLLGELGITKSDSDHDSTEANSVKSEELSDGASPAHSPAMIKSFHGELDAAKSDSDQDNIETHSTKSGESSGGAGSPRSPMMAMSIHSDLGSTKSEFDHDEPGGTAAAVDIISKDLPQDTSAAGSPHSPMAKSIHSDLGSTKSDSDHDESTGTTAAIDSTSQDMPQGTNPLDADPAQSVPSSFVDQAASPKEHVVSQTKERIIYQTVSGPVEYVSVNNFVHNPIKCWLSFDLSFLLLFVTWAKQHSIVFAKLVQDLFRAFAPHSSFDDFIGSSAATSTTSPKYEIRINTPSDRDFGSIADMNPEPAADVGYETQTIKPKAQSSSSGTFLSRHEKLSLTWQTLLFAAIHFLVYFSLYMGYMAYKERTVWLAANQLTRSYLQELSTSQCQSYIWSVLPENGSFISRNAYRKGTFWLEKMVSSL